MDQRQREMRLAQERWLRRLKRKDKLRRPLGQRPHGPDQLKPKYHSKVLDLFDPYTHGKLINLPPKRISLPSVFSISKNPSETLEILRDIISYARTCRRPRLVLDHRSISSMGLGADSLLGVILKEIQHENQNNFGSYIRGYKSTRSNIKKIMDEVGCVRVLNSGFDEDIRLSLKPTAKVFRHRNAGKQLDVDPLTSDQTSQTTRDFSDHLDECLSLVNRKLAPKGRDRLLAYVAEVLNNAQEHSGTAEWTIVGFIDNDDKQLTYRCVIFSLGSSICDTFNALPHDSMAWRTVEPYILRHEAARLFGRTWRRSDLLTVVALQGHVSSKLDEDPTRGQGTVDLIEFFQDVSMECDSTATSHEMYIISGDTKIVFDGKFKMQYEPSLNRMVIAFNSENNLLKRPDSTNVTTFSGPCFPGVMISITVPLAGGTVETLDSGKKTEN